MFFVTIIWKKISFNTTTPETKKNIQNKKSCLKIYKLTWSLIGYLQL